MFDNMREVNQFMTVFNNFNMLEFAEKYRNIGNLDAKIIHYLSGLLPENVGGVDGLKVFRGNFSDLAAIINYPDAPNVRKACLRLDAMGVIWIERKAEKRSVMAIVLNKYWMIKIMEEA